MQVVFLGTPAGQPHWHNRSQAGQAPHFDALLAQLCVYFKDTPVLDQLLSLSLFIESGEEEKLLEKANGFAFGEWDNTTRAKVLANYPQLSAKLPRKEPVEQVSLDDKLCVRLPLELEQSQAHWEPYEGRVQQWVRT